MLDRGSLMDEAERIAMVESVADGDQDALQRLIVHYHTPLRRAIATKIDASFRSYVDPDDILQQAYISAFTAIEQRQFSIAEGQRDIVGGFYKWLEAIALSRLKDQERALQRQKRDVRREVRERADTTASYPDLVHRLATGESTPSRQIAREEAIAAVMSCLARLSDDQRAVVQLRFLEGRSVADVAAELGKTESAVHMLCHRGLKSLRELMVSITHYLTRI
jgi:RNA polymerase sigma-70 factor (subfamily 1)